MSYFKPLNINKYPKTGPVVTPDTEYWKKLSVPTLVKEFGAIDYVDFSPTEPHYFAVTCSVRVQIYNPITKLVVKNLSRFQENAYGGTFRQDGRLLVAGDEQGLVKLFDTSSKNVLRLFKDHKNAVHRVNFTADLLHIASFSDDKTVKLWDLANEKVIQTFAHHQDYVRAGIVNPVSADVIISGGYDGKINMYDTRTNEVAATIDHGSPIESLLFLPTGGIFISAGGTEICVWDAIAGCRLLTRLSQHHKTVTCLRLGSNGKRILSGGLDRHVKIYDVASYQMVHSLNFPNAVLSLGVAPIDQAVVAGMVDGLVSIQNMEASRQKQIDRQKKISSVLAEKAPIEIDHEITYVSRQPLKNYDTYLRKYEYSKCLESVLFNQTRLRKSPEVTVSVMQELIHRKGLQQALIGRDEKSLSLIISFICRHIGEHRFMRVLIDVGMILLDIYEETIHQLSSKLGLKFSNLSNVLRREVALTYDLLELEGTIELLISAADVAYKKDNMVHFIKEDNTASTLEQTIMAKESSIVTI